MESLICINITYIISIFINNPRTTIPQVISVMRFVRSYNSNFETGKFTIL
jgi:hypothetical protein